MPRNLTRQLERAIRSKLADYMAGETSLRTFWRWFVPVVWDIDSMAPGSLRDLVYAIKLRVDEYSNGNWSEDRLRIELVPYMGFVITLQTKDRVAMQEPQGTSASASFERLPEQRGGWWLQPSTATQFPGISRAGSYQRGGEIRLPRFPRFEHPVASRTGSRRNRFAAARVDRLCGAASV